jgi:hypothetical protein
MRDEKEDGKYTDKPYYGIKGVRKISNAWIVVACVFFTAIGVGLQAIAIRYTLSIQNIRFKTMKFNIMLCNI